jgi:hypothetical protein
MFDGGLVDASASPFAFGGRSPSCWSATALRNLNERASPALLEAWPMIVLMRDWYATLGSRVS